MQNYGELVPLGGGDPIPLLKMSLLVGRRESCDIVLRFPNVSAHHCQLTLMNGYWYVRDLKSRNGVKVNNQRVVDDKRLDPGDEIAVAKHRFHIAYAPSGLGALGPPPSEGDRQEVFQKSLLERAGLLKNPGKMPRDAKPSPVEGHRYDILEDDDDDGGDDDGDGQVHDASEPD